MVLVLEDFFSIPIKIYKIIGIHPFQTPNQSKTNKHNQFLVCFCLLNLLVDVLAEAAYFVNGLITRGDFLKLINCVACTVFGAMGLEELLLMWRKRAKLLAGINFLRRQFPALAEHQLQYNVSKLYRESQAYMTVFAVLFIVLISSFNFSPVIVNIWQVYSGQGEWNTEFPFYMWFPFDPTASTPLYIVMYLLESWGGFTAVMSCLAMNLFLGAVVTQLCLQLKILKKDLQEAVESEDGDEKRNHQLKIITIKHNQIINCCREMDDIFTVSIFFNYMSSSLIICLVLFQVVVGEDLVEIIKFCLFLMSSLLQTLTMSHFGQEIIDHVRDQNGYRKLETVD